MLPFHLLTSDSHRHCTHVTKENTGGDVEQNPKHQVGHSVAPLHSEPQNHVLSSTQRTRNPINHHRAKQCWKFPPANKRRKLHVSCVTQMARKDNAPEKRRGVRSPVVTASWSCPTSTRTMVAVLFSAACCRTPAIRVCDLVLSVPSSVRGSEVKKCQRQAGDAEPSATTLEVSKSDAKSKSLCYLTASTCRLCWGRNVVSLIEGISDDYVPLQLM